MQRGQIGSVLSVAFSPDGQVLATGSANGTVRFWAVLVQALAPVHAVASVRGLEAGLHAFVECAAQVPIEPLVHHYLRQGILLMDLCRYYATEPTQRGVVLGYGGLERQEIAWVGKQIVAQVHAQRQEE